MPKALKASPAFSPHEVRMLYEAESGMHRASVYWQPEDGDGKQRDAYARLFVAAPRLLACAKRFLAVVDDYFEDKLVPLVIDDAARELEEAIAQAEGQETLPGFEGATPS